jgi:hypothetical protein
MTWIVWELQTTLDRQVAWPGEKVHASFMVRNPLSVPIYITSYAWNTNFYPVDQAVTVQANCIIPANSSHFLGTGNIRVPEVPDGQYQIDIVLETYVYNPAISRWDSLGFIKLAEPQRLLVVHIPRYRAFVSRSNRPEDRFFGDLVVRSIQEWGFDTHTVGINEIVNDPSKVPEVILEEILKADCLFAIATPRDVSAITNLAKTLSWLQSEVSFAYMAQKPLLIFADQSVHLEGLLSSPGIAVLPYDISRLDLLVPQIHSAMPVMRQAISEHQQNKLAASIAQAEKIIAYGAFIAGKAQGNLPQ